MYKVMIVDDETIILSGIKFLVDWEKIGCVISATARNGEDALEQIRKMPPDIVLADINMPVMDGITLLSKVSQEFPHIVFIMLTNLEEFELARKALQNRAVDYLLKSRLEASVLEEALERAKKERSQRARLTVADSEEFFQKKKQEEAANRALQEMILLKQREDDAAAAVLSDCGMLENYGYFYIPFDYSGMPDAGQMTKESRTELMRWIRELLQKTAENIYRSRYVLVDTGQPDVLVMFVYQEDKWEERAAVFRKKLASTVKNITQADCQVLDTGRFFGRKDIGACWEAYQKIMECYYLGIEASQWPFGEEAEYEPLGLQGIGLRLAQEIRRRSMRGVSQILDQAESAVRTTLHQKSQAIWLLNELNRSAASALMEMSHWERRGAEGGRISSAYEIDCINTRTQVLEWLEMLRNILGDAVENDGQKENLVAQRARKKPFPWALQH